MVTDDTDHPLYAAAPLGTSARGAPQAQQTKAAETTTYKTDDLEGFVRIVDLDPARRFRLPRGSDDYYHAKPRYSKTRVARERHPRKERASPPKKPART
jgi:hypothetical protein